MTFDQRFERVPAELDLPAVSTARFVMLALLVGFVLAVLSFIGASWLAEARQQSHQRDLAERLHVRAGVREDLVNTWAQGIFRLSDSVVQADVVRLFATEADTAAAKGQAATGPYQAQLPYMQVVMQDFARQYSLPQAGLLGRQGQALVVAQPEVAVGPTQQAAAAQVVTTGQRVSQALAGERLAMELFMPVFKLDAEPTAANVVAVFWQIVPIESALSEILQPNPLTLPSEVSRLLVSQPSGMRVLSTQAQEVLTIPANLTSTGVTLGLDPLAKEEMYSVTRQVDQLPWLTIYEGSTRRSIDAALQQALTIIYGTAAGLTIVLLLAVLTGVWKYVSARNSALAEQYRSLAKRINGQRRLLESITNTVDEHISVKDREGRYRYVNPTFARFWQLEQTAAVDQRDEDIMGVKIAQHLAAGDALAYANGSWFDDDASYTVRGQTVSFQIAKMPQIVDGEVTGLVTVMRDVTELRAQRRQLEQLMQSTISALVRTVELRDPYLVGHAGRLEKLGVLLAQQLQMTPVASQTIRFAARLAGVGKVFIPREILTKKGKLTKTELATIRQHVDHAVDILKPIAFDLPVVDTIQQMYERLDGSGYPKGSKGKAIQPLARVLAVADVFCALIAPRAYREALSVDTALITVQGQAKQFDADVLAALAQLVATHGPEGLAALLTETP